MDTENGCADGGVPHVGQTLASHPLHESHFSSWSRHSTKYPIVSSDLRLHLLLPFFLPAPGPLPHDGVDLPPQPLGGDLCLEHAAHAPPPGLVQPRDLAAGVALQPLAAQGDEVDGPAGGGHLALEGAQLRLEVPVAHQPRVLAVAVEQREVLPARGQVRGRRVGLGEGGLEAYPVGVAVLWQVRQLVPRQVYRAEGRRLRRVRAGGYAVQLGLDEGAEGWFCGRGQEGVVRVVWDRRALGGYEGFCCFALGLGGLWVDVWGGVRLLDAFCLFFLAVSYGESFVSGAGLCLHGSDSWTVVIEGMVGGRFGGVALCCDCDGVLLSSGRDRRKCRFWDCSRGCDGALGWLLAGWSRGWACGTLPCRPCSAPPVCG